MKIFTPQYLAIAAVFLFGSVYLRSDEPTKTIKRVPVTDANTIDGQQLFGHYCGVCHGKDAKGNGPAADALKKAPADLTQIARRAGGSFPEVHVTRVIKGEDAVGAHGSRDMPIWGELFTSLRGKETSELRVNALMKYLEGIQAK
ncbi:MAG TPA: c-type cytochrome [Bryobacteraceae bacterium]|jgi:mono/diheme cytochrome c family protein